MNINITLIYPLFSCTVTVMQLISGLG